MKALALAFVAMTALVVNFLSDLWLRSNEAAWAQKAADGWDGIAALVLIYVAIGIAVEIAKDLDG